MTTSTLPPAGGRRRFWTITITLLFLAALVGTKPLTRILREQRALDRLHSGDELVRHEASRELVRLGSTRAVHFWIGQILEGARKYEKGNSTASTCATCEFEANPHAHEDSEKRQLPYPDPWVMRRILQVEPEGPETLRKLVLSSTPAELYEICVYLHGILSDPGLAANLVQRIRTLEDSRALRIAIERLVEFSPSLPETRALFVELLESPPGEAPTDRQEAILEHLAPWLSSQPPETFTLVARSLEHESRAWQLELLEELGNLPPDVRGSEVLLPLLRPHLESRERDHRRAASGVLSRIATPAIEEHLEAIGSGTTNSASGGLRLLMERGSLRMRVLEFLTQKARAPVQAETLKSIEGRGNVIAGNEKALRLIGNLLESDHPPVRQQALRILLESGVRDDRILATLLKSVRDGSVQQGNTENLQTLMQHFGDRPRVRQEILGFIVNPEISLTTRASLAQELGELPDELAREVEALLASDDPGLYRRGIWSVVYLGDILRARIRLDLAAILERVEPDTREFQRISPILLEELDVRELDLEFLLRCLTFADDGLASRALFKILERGERSEPVLRTLRQLSGHPQTAPSTASLLGKVGQFWFQLETESELIDSLARDIRTLDRAWKFQGGNPLSLPESSLQRTMLLVNTLDLLERIFESHPTWDSERKSLFHRILRSSGEEGSRLILERALNSADPLLTFLAMDLLPDREGSTEARRLLEDRLSRCRLRANLPSRPWREVLEARMRLLSPGDALPRDIIEALVSRLSRGYGSPDSFQGILRIIYTSNLDPRILDPVLIEFLENSKKPGLLWMAAHHLRDDPRYRERIEVFIFQQIESFHLGEIGLHIPGYIARLGNPYALLAEVSTNPRQTGEFLWQIISQTERTFTWDRELGQCLAALASLGTHRNEVVGFLRGLFRKPGHPPDPDYLPALKALAPAPIELIPDLEKARELLRGHPGEDRLLPDIEEALEHLGALAPRESSTPR